jgi:uncharacterized membrane protein
MKQLIRYIFLGALAIMPFLLVVQMILWVNSISIQFFDFVSSYTNNPLYTTILFIIVIILLALVGSSIEKAGKSFIISIIDNLIDKVPAIRTIYSILKKITELFTPNNKDVKKEVVLVEYPKTDLWVPAYVLNKYESIYVLFVPTSPNPTSGYTVIVDKSKIQESTLTVAEASQFIVSMGSDFVKKEEICKIIKNTINK